VTFFDAAALRALLEMRQRNPRLRVINPSPPVQHVFEITDTHCLTEAPPSNPGEEPCASRGSPL